MVNQQKGTTMDTVGTGFWGSGSVFWFQGTSVRCSRFFLQLGKQQRFHGLACRPPFSNFGMSSTMGSNIELCFFGALSPHSQHGGHPGTTLQAQVLSGEQGLQSLKHSGAVSCRSLLWPIPNI